MIALAAGLAAFFVGQDLPQSTASHPFAGNLAAVASGLTWGCNRYRLALAWHAGRRSIRHPAHARRRQRDRLRGDVANGPARHVEAGPTPCPSLLGVFQIGLVTPGLSAGMAIGVPALESSLLLLLEPVLIRFLDVAGARRGAEQLGAPRRRDHSGRDDDANMGRNKRNGVGKIIPTPFLVPGCLEVFPLRRHDRDGILGISASHRQLPGAFGDDGDLQTSRLRSARRVSPRSARHARAQPACNRRRQRDRDRQRSR